MGVSTLDIVRVSRILDNIHKSLSQINQHADVAKAQSDASRTRAGSVVSKINKARLFKEFTDKGVIEKRANRCYAFPCQAPHCQNLGVCISDGPYNHELKGGSR